MTPNWTQHSTLSAREITTLTALDFEPEAEQNSSASSHLDLRLGSRMAQWLALAYPDLPAQDRRIRATGVALLTLTAIVAITLILFGFTTQPISTR